MELREVDRNLLIQEFKKFHFPYEVWAYGSRVNGNGHSGSDLDLVIRTPDLSPVNADFFYELTENIRASNIPILVQIADWARIPSSFHPQICKHYEILFQQK